MAVMAAVALTACSPETSGSPSKSPSTVPSTFVIDQDFPDPDVILVDGIYHAYATNSGSINVQMATSKDLKSWTVSDQDALPDLPAWATGGNTWAPDVSQISPGHFVLYFAAKSATSRYQCIGAATASGPAGPFVGKDKPLLCPKDEGGAIDPDSFVDSDGSRYVIWKNDGNCCGSPTWLQASAVSADGLSVTGHPTRLLTRTQDWEGNVVEAPTMVKHSGTYFLFYSANDYSGSKYAIGYATAPSVTGPFKKAERRLLTTEMSKSKYLGPGGQDVIVDKSGSYQLIFHSWQIVGDGRGMNVLPLQWKDGLPVVTPGT